MENWRKKNVIYYGIDIERIKKDGKNKGKNFNEEKFNRREEDEKFKKKGKGRRNKGKNGEIYGWWESGERINEIRGKRKEKNRKRNESGKENDKIWRKIDWERSRIIIRKNCYLDYYEKKRWIEERWKKIDGRWLWWNEKEKRNVEDRDGKDG